MGWSEILSIVAIAFSASSVWYVRKQAVAAKEANELQRAIRFSVAFDSDSQMLSIRNEGNIPVWIKRVTISRGRLSWEQIFLTKRIDPGATGGTLVPSSDISPQGKDSVTITYSRQKEGKRSDWEGVLP